MEKGEILDIKNNTSGLILLIAILFLSSCAVPRIIILNDPLSPEEHINLGVAYERNGELDHALREYETASRRLDIAYLYMGNIYFQKGDLENAERYYKKAIKKTESKEAYNNLAWLYYTRALRISDTTERMRLLKKGLELAGRALESSPDNEIFIDTFNKIKEFINREEER